MKTVAQVLSAVWGGLAIDALLRDHVNWLLLVIAVIGCAFMTFAWWQWGKQA